MAIFAAVTLLFFFPLVRGETFSDVGGRQQQIYPWAGIEQDRSFPVIHYDQAESFYPWQVFVSRALRHGEFPFWNPYSFGGAPFFANGQSGVLYPARLALTYTVSPARVHDFLLASHMFAAGVAMFLLLGFVGLSFPAAVVGGLAWMLNSFALAWQALEHYVAIGAWLPVGVLLAHATVRRRSWPAALGLGLVLALLFLGGNALFVELALAAILAYGVTLALADARTDFGALGGAALRLATAGVLFVGLAAVALLPTAGLTSESARAALGYRELAGYALPWKALRYVFVQPPATVPFFDPYHRALFAGTAVGALALVGLLARSALARLAAVLAVVIVLFMLHTPVTFAVDHLLPGLGTLKPLSRVAFLLQFALAVLSAHGLDIIARAIAGSRLSRWPRLRFPTRLLRDAATTMGLLTSVALLTGGLAGAFGGGLVMGYGRSHLDPVIAAAVAVALPLSTALAFEVGAGRPARQVVRSRSVAGTLGGAILSVLLVRSSLSLGVLVGAIFLALAVAILAPRLVASAVTRRRFVTGNRSPRGLASPPLALLLGAAVGVSIVWQMSSWADDVMLHQPNSDRYLYPRTPLIRHLEERREGRFLPTQGSFVGSTAMVYALESAGGYESLLPGRIENLWRVVGDAISPSALRSHPLIYAYHSEFRLSKQRPTLLARAGVDDVVAPPRQPLRPMAGVDDAPGPELPRERVPKGLKRAWDGDDGQVFPVPRALPRAYFVGACEAVANPLTALERFVAADFRAAGTVLLEQSSLRAIHLTCAGGYRDGSGSAEIVHRSLNSLAVRVNARTPGWLIVVESWDRGWRATVDGHRSNVLSANYAFRAVHVPAGDHDVRFVYRPPLFMAGAALSGTSLAVTICAFSLMWVRRRRAHRAGQRGASAQDADC